MIKNTLKCSVIESIQANDNIVHAVIGGSHAFKTATSTSDVDLIIVVKQQSKFNFTPDVDIEQITAKQLESFLSGLATWELRLNQLSVPFSFNELRLVSRLRAGIPIKTDGKISEELESSSKFIDDVKQFRTAGAFVSQYEDFLGLYLDQRYDEAVLRAGELLGWATLVGLQSATFATDISPKFAYPMALHHPPLRDLVQRAKQHLLSADGSAVWAERVLRTANGIAAVGACSFDPLMAVASPLDELTDIKYCFWCTPRLNAFYDVSAREVAIYHPNLPNRYIATLYALPA